MENIASTIIMTKTETLASSTEIFYFSSVIPHSVITEEENIHLFCIS